MPHRRRIAAATAAALAVLLLALLVATRGTRGGSPGGRGGARPAGAPSASGGPAPARLPIRLNPAPSADPDALPGSFEGRVVSRAGGAPVPLADLTFSRAGAAASVRAGSDGAFRFEAPAEGTWLLAAVTAPGFLPFAPEWGHSPVQFDARRGRHVLGVEIHLAPAVELLGRAVDHEGRGVAGAEIRLVGTAGAAALVAIRDRFRSDAGGEFRFSAPEGAVVEARRAGLAPGRAEVTTAAILNRRLTVVLGPSAAAAAETPLAISGRVVGPDGAAAPGALVVAGGRFSPAPAAQSVSGADGSFALAGLEPGAHLVEARAEGFAPAVARRVPAGTADLVLELSAGGRVRGCVRAAAGGTPVAPFTVFVFQRRGALWRILEQSRSIVDASGCFALDGISPGPCAVVVSAPGFAPSQEIPVDVVAGAEAIADARLEAGGRLTGSVLDGSTRAPIAGALLAVEGSLGGAASTFPALAEATTGPDGRFVLTGLPRRFSVAVAAAGHHARILGGVEVPAGGEAGPVEVLLGPLAPGEEPRVELAGIGIGIGARDDAVAVTAVREGGGASEAGLAPGDLILRVDGRPVEELGFGGAVDAIRGPEGTSVVLTVRRGDATFDVRVPRRLFRG